MALGRGDPVEAVARVAVARRDRLLRINRRRLRWEDLEDCYSQATLELVARARRDPFASSEHIVNALEQKFSSRIDDRRRAIGGRSPIETAMARALPVDAPEGGAVELEDRGAEVLRQVAGRLEIRRLREVAADLSDDQRLVLACQISLGMDCAEFCRRFGWSAEKFRKVAQRARGRLRVLAAEYQVGERCRRLEPDLLAYAAQAATGEQAERAAAHLANCTACASDLRSLDRASRQVAAVLPAPVPVGAGVGVLAKLGGLLLAGRRVFGSVGRGASPAGAGAGAGVAGGSAAGAAAVKLGLAAACLAGAAGGYAICGPVVGGRAPIRAHHQARSSVRDVGRAASLTATTASAPRVATVASTTPPRPRVPVSAAAVAHAEFGSGETAATAARREFSPASAHLASIVSRPTASGSGGSGAASGSGSLGTASGSGGLGTASGASGTASPGTASGSASSGAASGGSGGTASGPASSGAAGRASSQAQAEFGGFER
jgi:DNA-directed RNA polymerase specialized sigma24 family protein